jgi:hypothetical protein
VDAEPVDTGAAAADAEPSDAGVTEPEPATKARRPRRGRATEEPVVEAEPTGDAAVEGVEAAGAGSEIADEGATGPDEEQTDE